MRIQRPKSSIRSVLVGFAGLLILMGGLAVDSAVQTRYLAVASAALRHQSRERDALLDQLRNEPYRSATLARDYMLERDEVVADAQKAELRRLQFQVEETVNRYAAIASPEEKNAVENLRRHAASYWAVLAPALDWSRAARNQQGEAFLRNTLIPRRNEMLLFVKQVSILDEGAVAGAEAQIQQVQTSFQRRVKVMGAVTLFFAVLLAIIVVRHAQRLGVEAAARFDEALAAREALRQLSDRLVKVQEDERRALSRELHDDLGQTMSAMLIELGKLESARPGPEVNPNGLAAVRGLAEENVAKVRNMALLLRPAMLDELGLVPALRWHAREVTRRTGLKVKMLADNLHDDLPESSRTCIYRVVQEALNNCVKHSQAKEARVVVHRDEEGLSISVQDDGVGFKPEHNKGLGLLGMMERVSGLGGRFHIESQPGRGAVVSAYFPLEKDRCRLEEESVA